MDEIGAETGDSSGRIINLARALVAGESLSVMRDLRSSECMSPLQFVIEVR